MECSILRGLRFHPSFAGAVLLAVAAIASGCTTTETRSYRLDPAAAPLTTWSGKNVDQVLDVWGPPSERQGDGEGGSILVYREASAITASVTDGSKVPSPAPTSPGAPTTSERLTRVRARFWIDADGKVYRYWFSSDVYKKGEGELPAPKKPDADEKQR